MSDELTARIIACAIEVHRNLGPGLLESVYEEALCHEMTLQGIRFERQIEAPVSYKGKVSSRQRLDLLVATEVVVRSVSRLPDVAIAQVLSYLQATGFKRGLLINFGQRRLVDGIKRISVNSVSSVAKNLRKNQ